MPAPGQLRTLRLEFPGLATRIAPPLLCLCPFLAAGRRLRTAGPLPPPPPRADDDRVGRILEERVAAVLAGSCAGLAAAEVLVVVVDHGSPTVAVGRVREVVAAQLRAQLGDRVAAVVGCSMERRDGAEYDFNEPQLSALCPGPPGLSALSVFHSKYSLYDVFVWARKALNSTKMWLSARADTAIVPAAAASAGVAIRAVVVAPLFLQPGRHAGAGGDLDCILEAARAAGADPAAAAPRPWLPEAPNSPPRLGTVERAHVHGREVWRS